MNLETARKYAEKIVEWLGPLCYRIEIAGSVRRERANCNDIDIVCIPKLVAKEMDIFGKPIGVPVNPVRKLLVEYVRQTKGAGWRTNGMTIDQARSDQLSPKDQKDGKDQKAGEYEPREDAVNLLVKLRNCDLDVFCANEATFATRWMCRTGSKEHNIWVCERAQRMGGKWEPQRGLWVNDQGPSAKDQGNPNLKMGEAVTEADIYEALGLPWIKPKDREMEFLRRLDLGK
jgi:DNA polymerase/3'-5' exonuclease PolX